MVGSSNSLRQLETPKAPRIHVFSWDIPQAHRIILCYIATVPFICMMTSWIEELTTEKRLLLKRFWQQLPPTTRDTAPTKPRIFMRYSTGSLPTILFYMKYFGCWHSGTFNRIAEDWDSGCCSSDFCASLNNAPASTRSTRCASQDSR